MGGVVSKNMVKLFDRSGLVLAAFVFLACFLAAVVGSETINENGDVEHKWIPISYWAEFRLPDFDANHHNLRWGMNFPATVWVFLFGSSAASYLVLNYLVFSLSGSLLAVLTRFVSGAPISILAAAFWILNPTSYFMAPAFMPSLYTCLGLLIVIALICKYEMTANLTYYFAAILCLFVVYGIKETNVFFYFGLGLLELFRQRWKELTIAVVGTLFLFAVETISTNAILSSSHILFGRPQAIVQGGHITGMETIYNNYEYIDIARRWWLLNLTEYLSKIAYFAFFVCSFLLLFSSKIFKVNSLLPEYSESEKSRFRAIEFCIYIGLSFALVNTFFIISLSPLVLGQPLNDRYLWPLLPISILVIGGAIGLITNNVKFPSILRKFGERKEYLSILTIALLVISVVSHWSYRNVLIPTTRQGVSEPYWLGSADTYFNQSITEPLNNGCQLLFGSTRAAWSALAFSYPTQFQSEPEAYYERQLDGLTFADGRTLSSEVIPIESALEQWPALETKLHVGTSPKQVVTKPVLLRIHTSGSGVQQNCNTTNYLGYNDIPIDEQKLN
ncbi:MAG: hypothetical protein CMK09_16575 [Ponticaulis sp.]|nr:hypothetical protein [Ponticaulis sp.]|tara:strand:+ start:3988 stop:5667 length:1680 start_codon:yes stop_codon:yes gene_type:complete